MSESDAVGTVAEPPAEPVEEKLEGTTPQEVAEVLKSSGMDKSVHDAEEGDDPDEPSAPDADEEEPDETVEEDALDEEEDDPDKPLAPDEATTDDKYSFQIQDANGATFKITADAKMEDILSEFEPKNNGQILDILEKLREVKDLKAADDKRAADDATAKERRTAASKLLEGWKEEATVLQGSKRLPEGNDGQKRINEVYKFMASENEARQKAGKPTLNSFEDALDKLENKEARDKSAADAKADKERARSNGALVGGSSAASTNAGPVYRAGTAKTSNEALRSLGLL